VPYPGLPPNPKHPLVGATQVVMLSTLIRPAFLSHFVDELLKLLCCSFGNLIIYTCNPAQ